MKKSLWLIGAIVALGVLGFYAIASGAANPPALGGTGTSAIPSAGMVLIGNGAGTYTPTYLSCTSGCSVANASGSVAITVPTATGTSIFAGPYIMVTASGTNGYVVQNIGVLSLASSADIGVSNATGTGITFSFLNPKGYATTTIQSVLNALSAIGLASYNSSTGQFSVSSSSLNLKSASQYNFSDFLPSSTVYVANTNGNWVGTWQNKNAADFLASSTTYVSSFNTRTGAITLTSADVTTALGYTPLSKAILTINGASSTGQTFVGNTGLSVTTVTGSTNSTTTFTNTGVTSFNGATGTITYAPSTTIPTTYVTTFNGSSGVVTYAPSTTIPTNNNQLTNGAGYIATSTGLTVANFATSSISQFNNDAHYVTSTSGGNTNSTGTANFIPIFTNVTTLGTSTLQQSGTNIGNLPNPLYPVEISGKVGFYNASSGVYTLWNDSSSYAEFQNTVQPYTELLLVSPTATSSANPQESTLSLTRTIGTSSASQFMDITQQSYPSGTNPWVGDLLGINARGGASLLPFDIVYSTALGSSTKVFDITPINSSTLTSGFTATLDANNIYLGSNGTSSTGEFTINSAGANTCAGIYDADGNVVYGIADSLPMPSGCIGFAGYYHGIGVGGSSANNGSPIFGVLNSSQSSNGRGHVAFTVYDTNEVDTFNNELDDGAGNAFVSGTLQVFGVASDTQLRTASATITSLYDAFGNKYSTSTGVTASGSPLSTEMTYWSSNGTTIAGTPGFLILNTPTTTGGSAYLSIVPQGNYGSGSHSSSDGAINVDNSLNPNSFGEELYNSNNAATAPLLMLRDNYSTSTQGVAGLEILSNSTDPYPTISMRKNGYVPLEFLDTSQNNASGTGEFQINDRKDALRFEGRQGDNSQYNVAGLFGRPATGGQFVWGGSGDILQVPVNAGLFNIIKGQSSTMDYLDISSTSTSNIGNIFKITSAGNVNASGTFNASGTISQAGVPVLTGTKVDSANSITGAVTIAGTGPIAVSSSSQTITVACPTCATSTTIKQFLAPLGNFYPPGGSTNDVPTVNTVYVAKFYLPAALTVNGIGLTITAAGSSTAATKLGIYSEDGNTKFIDSGNITSSATGYATSSVPSVTLQPGTYWEAYSMNTTTIKGAGWTNSDYWGDSVLLHGKATNTASTTLPATLGPILSNGNNGLYELLTN